MKHQFLMSAGAAALAIVITAMLQSPSTAVAQVKEGSAAINIARNKAPAKPFVVPKTPDGVPDLQGYWTNNTIVPLQKPNGVTKDFFTPEEALENAKKQAERDEAQTTP